MKGRQITLKKLSTFLRYKTNTGVNFFRRNKIPFSEKFISNITEVINKTSVTADSKILHKKPLAFPELEELRLFWGVYKNITRMFKKGNRFDLYYDWEHIYSCILKEDRVVVKDLFEMWYVQHFQPKRILEIGSRTGRSLVSKMLFHYDIDNTLIFAIDPFVEQGSPARLKRNLKSLGASLRGLVVFVGYSDMIIPEIRRVCPELYFDFILVDGSHRPEEAYNDLCLCTGLLESSGVMCFDDLGPGDHELLPVWEQWKSKYGKSFTTKEYYKPYGFGVAQKM